MMEKAMDKVANLIEQGRSLLAKLGEESWVAGTLEPETASQGPRRAVIAGLEMVACDKGQYFKPEDAQFIAYARTAFPELLEALQATRREEG